MLFQRSKLNMANGKVVRRSEIIKQRREDYAEIQRMMNAAQRKIYGCTVTTFARGGVKTMVKEHYA